MNHQLSLEIPDTINTCVMRIYDTSIYLEDVPVNCYELFIQPPGKPRGIQIPLKGIRFDILLTACDLNLQTPCDNKHYIDLPDGLYVIKYSVDPVKEVFVEYNHLRITKLLLRIRKILCDLDISCKYLDEDKKRVMSDLNLLYMQLLAAKSYVEVCHKLDRGLELFHFVDKKLNDITCLSCK
jgi:hypothetical protein